MAFTAFTGTDRPNTASFASVMESMMASSPSRPVSVASATATSNSAFVFTSSPIGSATGSSQQPTTLSTVPSSSRSADSSSITATSASGFSGTIANVSATSSAGAAVDTDGGSTEAESCNNIACSPGLQAAVAVPIVVVVLAIVGLVIFLTKRKRNTSRETSSMQEKPKKDRARHLRLFSHDNELLTGQDLTQDSTHNDLSSRQVAGSTASTDTSNVQVVNAAPSYKDAIHHVQGMNMGQTGAMLGVNGLAATGVRRSESGASAPPPYGPAEIAPYNQVMPPVVLVHHPISDDVQDPFADAHNADGPFRDPSEDGQSLNSRPPLSRNSSMQTGRNADDVSSIGGSDTGSIREAQIGRHVSIASTGRVTHIRNSSYSNQSPPKSPALS